MTKEVKIMRVLSGLEPQNVFKFFEEICSIPHGSGNTGAIADYCVSFAKERGLEYNKDNYDNVLIRKKNLPSKPIPSNSTALPPSLTTCEMLCEDHFPMTRKGHFLQVFQVKKKV